MMADMAPWCSGKLQTGPFDLAKLPPHRQANQAGQVVREGAHAGVSSGGTRLRRPDAKAEIATIAVAVPSISARPPT